MREHRLSYSLPHSCLCSSILPAQWVRDMNNFEGGIIECLSSSGDTVVAGTRGGGVYVSTDGGQNWVS